MFYRQDLGSWARGYPLKSQREDTSEAGLGPGALEAKLSPTLILDPRRFCGDEEDRMQNRSSQHPHSPRPPPPEAHRPMFLFLRWGWGAQRG